MTSVTHRLIAVGKIPTAVPGILKYAKARVSSLTGNTLIPSPSPSIATLSDLATKLDVAETATKSRTTGTIAARDFAKGNLVVALHASNANVQQVADANPEQAEGIITSVQMTTRKSPSRTKAPFVVKAGPISGSVHLAAKAAAMRASYDWEWSGDGGKTWTQVTSTLQAKTTILGLPVATSCQFRFRSVTRLGESDWSQVITFVVK